MTSPYKSDVGYELRVALSFSLSGAVKAYLDVRAPGESTSWIWECESTGYDDTTLYYITTSSTKGNFDNSGAWRVQPRIIFGSASSATIHDSIRSVTVEEIL